jgi:AcrR family transcriptional regulator
MGELPPRDPVAEPATRRRLPVVGAGAPGDTEPGTAPGPQERADAARNRRRILAAAAELFAERGVGAVSMDDVANRAGVGKGTLYRRFGDRSGLAVALLDDREGDLQARILTGPPPLGPGAPPAERLAAFVHAYLRYVAATLDLVLLSQTSTPGARHQTGSHAFWTSHCRLQFAAAATPDPELRADVLLAALTAEQVQHWLRVDAIPLDDLAGRLEGAARALATS